MADIEKTEVIVQPSVVDTEINPQDNIQILQGRREYAIVGDAYVTVHGEAPQWLYDVIDSVTKLAVGNLTTAAIEDIHTNVKFALDELYGRTTKYADDYFVKTTAYESMAAHVDVLQADYNNNFSRIGNIETTYASKAEASAIAINTINAELTTGSGTNLRGYIDNIKAVVANEQGNISTQISHLNSSMIDAEGNIAAQASATESLSTYVGMDENGDPTGTGILASVEILQKQADGIIDVYTGTVDVMGGIQDPDTITSDNELKTTVTPYSDWAPITGTVVPTATTYQIGKVYTNTATNTYYQYNSTASGNVWEVISATAYATKKMDLRNLHLGDSYILYSNNADGTKNYIRAYKFVKTAIDSTSPYSTDAEGYTWAVVTDTDAQAAYLKALQAKATADGKMSVYFAIKSDSAVSGYTMYFTTAGVLKKADGTTITGNSGDELKVVTRTGTSPDYKYDYSIYTYNGSSWALNTPGGLVAKSSWAVDLDSKLKSTDGTYFGANSELTTLVIAKDTATSKEVQAKFIYGSTLYMPNGQQYTSGFGMTSTAVGSEANSEFWINADKFRFTNTNGTGSVAPFTIDASGPTPQISFQGNVNISNRASAFGTGSGIPKYLGPFDSAPTGVVSGDTYKNNGDGLIYTYDGSNWISPTTHTFDITNTAALFKQDQSAAITPSSIILSTAQTGFIAATYAWYKDQQSTAIIGATSSSYTVPASDYTGSVSHTYYVKITGTVNGVGSTILWDQITIPKLLDALNVITAVLSNENITFAAPTTGTTDVLWSNGDCTISVYQGTTALTYKSNATTGDVSKFKIVSVTGSTGMTCSSSGATTSISGMTQDSGYADVVIGIYDAASSYSTVTKRITYSLSRVGGDGSPGGDGDRGAGFYRKDMGSGWNGAWNDASAVTACPGGVVFGDVVTEYYTGTIHSSITKQYNGSSWAAPALAIDGDMIATGTITAGKISTTNLSSISSNLGSVTTGLIQNSTGTMTINLNSGYIYIQ